MCIKSKKWPFLFLFECSQKFVYHSGWKVFVFPKPFAKFSGFAFPYYIHNGNSKFKQPARKNVKSLSPLYIIHRTVMWMRWTSGIRFTRSLETLLIFCCLQEDVQLHSCVPANCTKSYSAHTRGLHNVEKNIVFFFYKSQLYIKNKC